MDLNRFETPLISAVLVLACLEALKLIKLSPGEMHGLVMVSQLFFLNVVHVGFTFGFLYGSRRGRDWLDRVGGTSRRRSLLVNTAVFAALALGISLLFGSFLNRDPEGNWATFITVQLLLIVVLPAQHRLGQSFGLYPRHPYDSQLKPARLMFTWLAIPALTVAFLAPRLESDLGFLRAVLAGALFFLAAYVWWRERRLQSTHGWFSLRFFLWPLAVFSDVAIYGLIALHGIEYLSVYRKLVGYSEWRAHLVSGVFAAVLLICFLLRPVGGAKLAEDFLRAHPLLIASAAGVSYALSLMHFFWDRKIFKMSDPRVRAVIGNAI
jgi:hypothetical protein